MANWGDTRARLEYQKKGGKTNVSSFSRDRGRRRAIYLSLYTRARPPLVLGEASQVCLLLDGQVGRQERRQRTHKSHIIPKGGGFVLHLPNRTPPWVFILSHRKYTARHVASSARRGCQIVRVISRCRWQSSISLAGRVRCPPHFFSPYPGHPTPPLGDTRFFSLHSGTLLSAHKKKNPPVFSGRNSPPNFLYGIGHFVRPRCFSPLPCPMTRLTCSRTN